MLLSDLHDLIGTDAVYRTRVITARVHVDLTGNEETHT